MDNKDYDIVNIKKVVRPLTGRPITGKGKGSNIKINQNLENFKSDRVTAFNPRKVVLNETLDRELDEIDFSTVRFRMLMTNDELNLAVVIRTLIISNNKFEFQVGGGITFDSNEEEELDEIYVKAKAIAKILGIENFFRKH
jgi:para-aminobenzoate synthetase component 1